MAYFAFFVLVMVAWAFVLLGEAIAIGLALASVVHLARRRPAWYVRKILKGAGFGAAAGGVVTLWISPPRTGSLAETIFWMQLAVAAAGYCALVAARVYFRDRMEIAGPPI